MPKRYALRSWVILIFSLFTILCFGQRKQTYTLSDSLRGALRPERTCYDVTHYKLDIEINHKRKSINGYNEITFFLLDSADRLQIDLFENMDVDSIVWQDNSLEYERNGNAIFIEIGALNSQETHRIKVFYHGTPIVAERAPWDGGFVWTTDNENRPWIGVACEGTGASLWWPNKDHLSDEPDSMDMFFTVDQALTCISNGNLIKKQIHEKTNTFHWKVSYPINNYNVTLNIGHYVSFSDPYISPFDQRILACDYYVLDYNIEKAKKHFKQNHKVIEAFEYYLAPYPFWKDGYALVETPYLGMEHQSAIAYGNRFMRGYLGGMIPSDMDWDYIIVHEGGHEWWGNAVSAKDHAEIWIHESFTTYMEALFVEYYYGYEDMLRYLKGQRRHSNKTPIVGPLDVNYMQWVGSDEYFKGSWILHTFRHIIGEDVWFDLLKSFYTKFQYKTIHTSDFISFANEFTRGDYTVFFNQYLYTAEIPTLLHKVKKTDTGAEIHLKWDQVIDGFNMPVLVSVNGKSHILSCSQNLSIHKFKDTEAKSIRIAKELQLVNTKKLK